MKPGKPVEFCADCPPVADAAVLDETKLGTPELGMTELRTTELGAIELDATVLGAIDATVVLSSGEYVNMGGL